MSFLDNLENSLKSMESREESAQSDKEDRKRRDQEFAQAHAAAPWAEELRSGPFTAGLLNEASALGHKQRMKVHIIWNGTMLRLEAREKRLEMRPQSDGVLAVFLEKGTELKSELMDLKGDPAKLAGEWLESNVSA